MPTLRDDRPYLQFNFLINLGNGTAGPDAGFQECSAVSSEVTVTEYRRGNDTDNNVTKIHGLNKVVDITLKRGVIGSETLFKIFDETRMGNQATRDVSIHLQNEQHEVVMTWNLSKARITKITHGPFNAKGNDVAIEEIVLAYERLTWA